MGFPEQIRSTWGLLSGVMSEKTFCLNMSEDQSFHLHLKSNRGRVFYLFCFCLYSLPTERLWEITRKDSVNVCHLTQLLRDTKARQGQGPTFLITLRIKQPPTDSKWLQSTGWLRFHRATSAVTIKAERRTKTAKKKEKKKKDAAKLQSLKTKSLGF